MVRVLMSVGLAALTLSACASFKSPDNIEAVARGDGYQSRYHPVALRKNAERVVASLRQECASTSAAPTPRANADVLRPPATLLSTGDIVSVTVADDEVFSGDFEVSEDGAIHLPLLSPIEARGRLAVALERDIAAALAREAFYGRAPQVSTRLKDAAGAAVDVSGAVFAAGRVVIGEVSAQNRDIARQQALGAGRIGRTLTAALRAAGGVRPDADLSRVTLVRDDRESVHDLRGAVEGASVGAVLLVAGDRIVVPSRGCFQPQLVTPTAISPPGVTVYMSNLTRPASSNANSAIGKSTREMPYGTRFLQAVFNMNCMGGAKATNANRSAVLFSRNPVSGESVVVERNLEALLRRADRDDFDPYLLPGDAIACYDSTVTNITEVARAVGVVLGAGVLLAL